MQGPAPSWTVRPAVVADAGGLADLAAATFVLACPPQMDREAIARHVRSRLSSDAFAIAIADPGLRLLVAHTAGGVAGYVLLVPDGGPLAPHPDLVELRQIYVGEQHHGTGVADSLMAAAVRIAQELGGAGMWLGTAKQNSRALAFYRRSGFEVVAERVFDVGGVPNQDWVLVRRFA
jgi:tRNA (guanine37-N1)-methyltransferase